MLCLSTYDNDRIRLGGSLFADARTSVPTVRGGDYCMRYILFACSLGARPALGAATTVDIRCLSSIADARTSVPTVRMCEELMLVDCSLVYGHRDGILLPHVNNRYLS